MKKPSFYNQLDSNGKYILTCCFFVFAVNGLYAMILGSLLPLISSEYELNNTASGALISAHQTGNLIAGFIAGILPVYLGRKKAILFLCSFAMIGFIVMIVTANPVLLILAFLFTGLSRGSISNFNNSVVNEVSNGSASALSFLHSIFAVGALLAPFLVILCTGIAGDTGWKIAAVIIAVLISVSIFLFSRIKNLDDVQERKKNKLSYKFLTESVFWRNAGILFFYLCAEATVNGWVVKYFVDINIMAREYAQMLASLLWAAVLTGRLVIVFTGDRVPKKTILLVTSIGTALFYTLLLSTQNLAVITAAMIGLGLSMAGIYPTVVSNIGGTIKAYPMSMGVLLLLGGAGAIVMPTVTGILADAFGVFAGMSAVIVAILCMLGFVIKEITSQRLR